ncbi:MaoC/PaaZ C-terminal domain-containing protein [Rhizobium sp. C4]|uniref:MaoC/PaaZ C-terminal domain-containing protein n=1 Tax=Rhizobium sp. C4 TaxID=1349800 RepID=UPI001E33DB44|nr:MaoC/PaaZ C-terminal domain-containing protein [Rhizobium sp. C4]MCD2172217.1 hypothetical protein [Rhizobium sp. C4]
MSAASHFEPGRELPPLSTGPILRHHLVEWCAAENDYFNIHYDDKAATAMGLAGCPIQGTYKFALFSKMIEVWLAGRGRIVGLSARYRMPDFEGASLRIEGTVLKREARRLTVELSLTNEAGQRTTDGLAQIELYDEL